MLSPHFKVFAYNISFDKEAARLRRAQPKLVLDAISAYWANTLNRDLVCQLFRQDLVDAIVFNDFDMRWDTLQWPPSAAHGSRRSGRGTRASACSTIPRSAWTGGHLAVILRPAPASPAGC